METDPNEEGKEYAIAGGGRYDYLARFLGSKKDIETDFAFWQDKKKRKVVKWKIHSKI